MIDEDEGGEATPLGQTRQVTIDALCEHFANDAMDVEEFERRVDTAHEASTVEELRELLRDLPGGAVPAVVDPEGEVVAEMPALRRSWSITRPENVKDESWAIAILGGTVRKGRWTPARETRVVAFCGGAELDFREAVFAPGVTEVEVYAMWGGVEIIVPPGLKVECHGIGIMGGFDHTPDRGPEDLTAPTLRISGVALMGGVDVTVRHSGETARDARRRRREERRAIERDRKRGIHQLGSYRDGGQGSIHERLAERREARRELRSGFHEGLADIKDAARETVDEVKRQLRKPGSGSA